MAKRVTAIITANCQASQFLSLKMLWMFSFLPLEYSSGTSWKETRKKNYESNIDYETFQHFQNSLIEYNFFNKVKQNVKYFRKGITYLKNRFWQLLFIARKVVQLCCSVGFNL